jgi:hypothetical protein
VHYNHFAFDYPDPIYLMDDICSNVLDVNDVPFGWLLFLMFKNASRPPPPIQLSFVSTLTIMSSDSESESSDTSTGSSSTRPGHINEVIKALKHNDQG